MLAMLCLGVACGSGDGTSGDDVRIPETTEVLDQATLDALAGVTEDLSELRFDRRTAQLDTLLPGDVLVAGVVEPYLPWGLLRRVVTVDRGADAVIVRTERASITDAVERGSFRVSGALTEDVAPMGAPLLAPSGPVARRTEAIDAPITTFGLNDVVLYDGDDDPTTTFDQILLDGSLTFAPSFDMTVDITLTGIEEVSVELAGELGASLALEVRAGGAFDERFPLASVPFPPIVTAIGPVPIVLVPTLDFYAGIDGSIAGAMTTSTAASTAMSVSFGYVDGGFEGDSDFDSESTFDPPTFSESGHATARGYGAVRFSLKLYGIAGVYVEGEAYVRARVQPLVDPWWRLTAGMNVDVGFDLLGYEWEDTLVDPEVTLDQGEGASPTSQVETFSKTFGGDRADAMTHVEPLDEGGAVFAGSTLSFGVAPPDAWLLRVDRLGNPVWERTYEDLSTFTAFAPRADGGWLAAAGRADGAPAGADTLLALGPNGDVRWARAVGEGDFAIHAIVSASDGGAYLGGVVGAGAGRDFWIARVDASGAPRWQRRIGADEAEVLFDLVAVGDGLVASGTTDSNDTNPDGWAVRFDADGDVTWQRVFAGGGSERFHGAVAYDGDVVLVGTFTLRALLARVDAGTGAVVWARTHETETGYQHLGDVVVTPDGLLVAGGQAGIYDEGDRAWLLAFDGVGDIRWSRVYGGAGGERFGQEGQYLGLGRALAIASDGALLAGGRTDSAGAGDFDAWLVGLTQNGVVDLAPDSGLSQAAMGGETADLPLSSTATAYPVSATALPFTALGRGVVVVRSTRASLGDQGG